MDIDTILSTNRLFHYTSSKEKLISILENGFKPRFSLEKLGILKNDTFFDFNVNSPNITDEFAIPMCCFCDIPLNLVDIHINVYGDYSIGLTKEWGEKQAICPVIYLPNLGETRVLFENLITNYQKNINTIKNKKTNNYLFSEIFNFYDDIIDLIMFVKPYIGFYEKNKYKNENHKFYDEREWRYKPNKMICKSYMTKQEFNSYNSDNERNKYMDFITFNITDITDIIVPEIEVNLIRNIIKEIPKYKDFDLKIIDSIKNKK